MRQVVPLVQVAPRRPVALALLLSVLLVALLSTRVPPSQAQGGAYVLAETWQSVQSELPADAWRRASGVDLVADGSAYLADMDQARLTVIGPDDVARVLAPPDGSDDGLVEPGHLAVDGVAGRLYVADAGADAVAVFALDGRRLATWGNVPRPAGIALLPDGNVVVTAAETGEVLLYTADGIPIHKFFAVGPTADVDLVRGVDVDADGRIYVIDGRARRVLIFNEEGRPLDTLSVGGPDTAEVLDIAVDYNPGVSAVRRYWLATSAGLYLHDPRTGVWQPYPIFGRVTAVAVRPGVGLVATVVMPGVRREGSRIARLPYGAGPTEPATWRGGSVVQLGVFDGPEVLSIGADGRAYVLDRAPRVQRFLLNGTVIGQVRHPNPVEVDAAPDGTLMVSDGAVVEAYDPARDDRIPLWSAPVAPPGREGHAVGLVYNPVQGEVVVLDAPNDVLRRFSLAGQRTTVTNLTPAADGSTVWADLTVDEVGNLYVLDRSNRVVHRVAPDGSRQSIALPVRARQIATGPAGWLFTLDRDGWVRRYDLAGTRTAAFDATRFDLALDSRPSDLAVDGAGHVYVTDRNADVVSRFSWDPAATPEEPPSGATCRSFTDKTASPREIPFGSTVEVRLTLRGACGATVSTDPLDIILILDRSGSMQGEKIQILRQAARNFVAEVDFSTSRVGIVSFTGTARVEAPLSANAALLRAALMALDADPMGVTAIDRGLAEGFAEMSRRGRPQAKHVFILLSDGASDLTTAVEEADRAKRAGVEIYAIGIQAWETLMLAVATDPDHYFPADSARFLYGIFEQILERVTAVTLFRQIELSDEVPANMRYVPDSAVPPAQLVGRALRWSLADVPFAGLALRYELEPLELGDWPTNVVAWGDYVDGFGNTGRVDFPVPWVRVLPSNVPTATPTPPPTVPPTDTPAPTATPPPTATPRPTGPPEPIFIPLALKERCVPGYRHADIMLVLDTSISMTGAPLEAAKQAARLFIGLLDLPGDQVGVVAFNAEATLLSRLAVDASHLDQAINALTPRPGTRIFLGLEVAAAELASDRHRPTSVPVIVLLTDGVGEDTPRTLRVAAQARADGVMVFAIGLGADVDAQFLEAMAGARARRFIAPGPGDLAGIYRQVAGVVPCPPEAFWGGR
jgi:Mg-chelatase subunit ChlD/sugar lactone lactonase YvrE